MSRDAGEEAPRIPNMTSFLKLLAVWVLVSVVALMCWLKSADELPPDLVPVIPFAGQVIQAGMQPRCSRDAAETSPG